MKKFLLTLVCALLLAAPATAAVKSFSKFTIDIPDGWSSSEDGAMVAVFAPANAAALSIVHDDTGGATAEQLATAMSTQLQGSKPVKNGEAYMFDFTKNGNKSQCVLIVDGAKYAMFTITDPSGKYGEQISAILGSIKDK